MLTNLSHSGQSTNLKSQGLGGNELDQIWRATLLDDQELTAFSERINWTITEAESIFGQIESFWKINGPRYSNEREYEFKNGTFLISKADVLERELRLLPIFIRDILLLRIEQDASLIERVIRVLDEMHEANFSVSIAFPDLLRFEIELEKVLAKIRQDLSSSNERTVVNGAKAVLRWAKLHVEKLVVEPPNDLFSELVTLVSIRRQFGLATLIEVLVNILENAPGLVTQAHINRLVITLEYLRHNTQWLGDEMALRSPLVEEDRDFFSNGKRAAAVRLAAVVHVWFEKSHLDIPNELLEWKKISATDPMPEVRIGWDSIVKKRNL